MLAAETEQRLGPNLREQLFEPRELDLEPHLLVAEAGPLPFG
jgi:hypothetical protein